MDRQTSWLPEPENINVGHGVSLLCLRSRSADQPRYTALHLHAVTKFLNFWIGCDLVSRDSAVFSPFCSWGGFIYICGIMGFGCCAPLSCSPEAPLALGTSNSLTAGYP